MIKSGGKWTSIRHDDVDTEHGLGNLDRCRHLVKIAGMSVTS
jgi:hypothetical protein